MYTKTNLLKVFSIKIIVILCLFSAVVLLPGISDHSGQAMAERVLVPGPSFRSTPGFRERVDFWVDIFTKYGKNHSVLHYRNHPSVVYGVIDLSKYENRLSHRAYAKKKNEKIKHELKQIRAALNHLAKGREPRNARERHILSQFKKAGLNKRKYYREAADKKQIRSQTGIKERFRDGLVRSGRYLYAIEQIFRAEGLPIEISRLPLVESSFDYEAYSSVGAAGIWQFMRRTGQSYMRVNSAIDERRDPIIATRAAAKYLKHSYSKLGVWSLAVTSYNHGLTGVMRAVKATGSKDLEVIVRKYKGGSFGFASSNFWSEFIAALEVETNSERYFPGLKREAELHFEEVKLGRPIYFRELVRISGTSDQETYWLNRALRDPIRKNQVRIPQSFLVKVPPGRGRVVVASVPNSKLMPLIGPEVMRASVGRKPKAEGRKHRVLKGETIGSIARKYRVSQWELMEANRIRDPRRLRSGSRITIPGVYSRSTGRLVSSAKADSVRSPARSSSYVVRRGDTVGVISRKFGVSQKELMSKNGIKNPRYLRIGQKLVVPAISSASPGISSIRSPARSSFYVVRQGDTVAAIARKFGVSQKELMSKNGINNPRYLRIGQKLVVPAISSASPGIGSSRKNNKSSKATYTVLRGDTLGGIAEKNGISLGRLRQLNPGIKNKIYPGQVLVISP